MKTLHGALLALLMLFLGVLSAGTSSGQEEPPHEHEQRIFDAESLTVRKPVALPAGVLEILSQDKDVKQVLESQGKHEKNVPSAWFVASLVPTTRPAQELYLVMGNGPLIGANSTTFWLVVTEERGGGVSVILKTTANRLEIGKIERYGYPDITAARLTATTRVDDHYRFANGKYVVRQAMK